MADLYEITSPNISSRFDLFDSRITVLSAQLEELSKGVSILQHQVADTRVLVDGRITELGKLSEELSKGIGILQNQVADSRSEATAQLKLLSANLASLTSRQEDVFRRLRTPIAGGNHSRAADLYLDLLEDLLTGTFSADGSLTATSIQPYDPALRNVGFDWPATAETMIGRARMRNLRVLLERTLAENTPGDFIETGVWRGGACIYARAVLAAYDNEDRRVFVADSFRGLPAPDAAAYPADAGDTHSSFQQLSVTREDVENNFRRYGLLDDQVVFLEGWFKDTLPNAPIERLCLLRLDGDMYESTMQALEALYEKVSPGGFVIVDDYVLPPCRKAVEDFRALRGIRAPMQDVDGAAVWWQVPKG